MRIILFLQEERETERNGIAQIVILVNVLCMNKVSSIYNLVKITETKAKNIEIITYYFKIFLLIATQAEK